MRMQIAREKDVSCQLIRRFKRYIYIYFFLPCVRSGRISDRLALDETAFFISRESGIKEKRCQEKGMGSVNGDWGNAGIELAQLFTRHQFVFVKKKIIVGKLQRKIDSFGRHCFSSFHLSQLRFESPFIAKVCAIPTEACNPIDHGVAANRKHRRILKDSRQLFEINYLKFIFLFVTLQLLFVLI